MFSRADIHSTQPTGRCEVGKPINKVLQSTFDVLTFERVR